MLNTDNKKMNNDNWIRCKKCGHKLMKVIDAKAGDTIIEIKCSSCKAITSINIKERR